ncbi:hypothetical protein H0H93_007309 [Arthromyces matolae]|nr:hypothetical protein H0H93_007309 [Arthromyces matolae]
MMATFGAVTALPLEARDGDHDLKDTQSDVIKSVEEFKVFLQASAVPEPCKSTSVANAWGEVMVDVFPDTFQAVAKVIVKHSPKAPHILRFTALGMRNMEADKNGAFDTLCNYVGSEITETFKDTSLSELFSRRTSPVADAIRARCGPRGITPLDATLLHVPPVAGGWNLSSFTKNCICPFSPSKLACVGVHHPSSHLLVPSRASNIVYLLSTQNIPTPVHAIVVVPRRSVKGGEVGKGADYAVKFGMDKLAGITVPRWFGEPSKCAKEDSERGERYGWIYEMVERTPVDGFVAGAGALSDYDLYQANDKGQTLFSSPVKRVLLVAGSLDGGGNIGKGLQRLRDEWNTVCCQNASSKAVEYKEIPGAGHLPMIDEAEHYADVLRKFLDGF